MRVNLRSSGSFVDIPIELQDLLGVPPEIFRREQYQKLTEIIESTGRGETGFRSRLPYLHIFHGCKVLVMFSDGGQDCMVL